MFSYNIENGNVAKVSSINISNEEKLSEKKTL